MHKFKALLLACALLLLPASALADTPVALANGDFDQVGIADGLPLDWYAEAWITGEDAYTIQRLVDEDGAPCVQIVAAEENDVRLCQTIPVAENSYYRISCELHTQDVSGGGGANVSVVGSLAASEPVVGTSNGWQQVELVGKTGADQEEMTICIRLGGYGALCSGTAWFRNVEVVQLDSLPVGVVAADFGQAPASQSSEGTHNVNELHSGAMLLATAACAVAGLWIYMRRILPNQPEDPQPKPSPWPKLAAILAGAFVLRLALSLVFYGHSTDMGCFLAWGNAMAEGGPGAFYTSGFFSDYPPGYMYVLWLTGGIAKLLGLSYGGSGHVLLTKMPAILCDLAAAYVVFRMADKRLPRRTALLLCGLVALNPAMAFLSGGWGQIDQVLTLALLLVVWLLTENRLEWAGLAYGIAILIKPQALMAGPLFAGVYFVKIHDQGAKTALRTLAAVALAVGIILLLCVPFSGGQGTVEVDFLGLSFQGPWFLEKLLGTATSYPYASIEAFNLFALLGGNWQPVDAPFLFSITYGQWGTACMVLCVLAALWMYIRGRKENGCLPLSLAFLLAGLFTLGQYMHERYLFPVLLLLMVSFIAYEDRRLFLCYVGFTCSLLLNSLAAFMVVKDTALRGAEYDCITVLGSILTVLTFAYFAWVCWDLILRKRRSPAFEGDRRAGEIQPSLSNKKKPEESSRFTSRDRLLCGTLTLVYGVIAIINLGTMQAPETVWQASAGQGAVLELEQETQLSCIRVFGGLDTGTISIAGDDGSTLEYTEENGDMFRWVDIGGEGWQTKTLTIQVQQGTVWFNEIACFDQAGNYIPITGWEATGEGAPEAALLCDEPDQVPAYPSSKNGMYFDELYHARTAYEHLHGLTPYENSHPPLGKIFIMAGIAVFGMNAFGWRIVGTLFGIGMVPILYLFAKRLFGKSEYALLAAGLFAFDFMHYTQTRIATIDVYGVFFILLMYYFMYRYYTMNFFTDGLFATLKPLAWAGVFFGLGVACKWIGIYAGAGLAVIFFTSLTQRYMEYRRNIQSKDVKKRAQVSRFWRQAIITLLWCCLFYILVPASIYLASYLPYVWSEAQYDLKGIWGVQEFMFNYHSTLTASHPYESPWWQWPLDIRPVWYYVGYEGMPANYAATISAFGNPAVWWICSLGGIGLAIRLLMKRIRYEKGMFVLLTGVCANYLPWVLVTRCTFAYHFFATVPFLILCTVYLVKQGEEKKGWPGWVKWAWLGAAAVLFVAFYPVLSGTPAPASYIHALEWMPTWTFLGY